MKFDREIEAGKEQLSICRRTKNSATFTKVENQIRIVNDNEKIFFVEVVWRVSFLYSLAGARLPPGNEFGGQASA